MGTLALPNTITPGTNEDAADVQENDVAIRDFINSGTGIGTNNIAVLPACRVRKAAAQSIPDSTFTAITFDTERFDTDSMHSTSVNTSRITFTTAGVYVVTAHIAWDASATNRRLARIQLNGATTLANAGVTGLTFAEQSLTTIYSFAAADYVELLAFQNSGGALDVTVSGNASPEFGAAFITRAS